MKYLKAIAMMSGLDNEKWKDIKCYEGLYQISSFGRIKSLARFDSMGRYVKEKILKTAEDNRGYLSVNLSKYGKHAVKKVHILVAIYFKGHVQCGYDLVVDHIDNNQSNNYEDNLQLISARKNTSKDRIGYSSKYVGVSWDKSRCKWVATIQIEGKTIFLGRYKKELEASNTYQRKLKQIK